MAVSKRPSAPVVSGGFLAFLSEFDSYIFIYRQSAHHFSDSGRLLRTLFREDWVVYAKRPFGGPEHVLHYLARSTHRVAISTHRLVDLTDTHVTFRWKDYAHHKQEADDDTHP